VDSIGPFAQDQEEVNNTSALAAHHHLLPDFLAGQTHRRELDVERLLPPVKRMA